MKRAFWILVAVLCLSIAVNVWQWKIQPEPSVVVEHDTVWKDSIIREPAPAETIQTGRVVYIKVAVPQPQTQRDTVHDSIEVALPVEQKRYDDSLYTAWVSGFQPALDSIQLHLPEVQTTTTITYTIVKPSPRFSIGLQAGGGYGIVNKQFDVFVGIGGQINLWRK